MVKSIKASPEKIVKVKWNKAQGLHPTRLRLITKDRVGILAEVRKSFYFFWVVAGYQRNAYTHYLEKERRKSHKKR